MARTKDQWIERTGGRSILESAAQFRARVGRMETLREQIRTNPGSDRARRASQELERLTPRSPYVNLHGCAFDAD